MTKEASARRGALPGRSVAPLRAGGSATASGINYQALATAVVAVHILGGWPLDWLRGIRADIPVCVAAETGGAGDDIRLELRGGEVIEVQVKRGLTSGAKLWDSLLALARAINDGALASGVLLVSPDSSRSITVKLARDIRRLAEGRNDGLSDLGRGLRDRLVGADLPVVTVCSQLAIHVLHGVTSDDGVRTAAKVLLGGFCGGDPARAEAVWTRLATEAAELVERRGRWDATTLLRTVRTIDVGFAASNSPAGILTQILDWNLRTNATFSVLGSQKELPIDGAWIPLQGLVDERRAEDDDISAALDRYHGEVKQSSRSQETRVADAEWIGRFYRLAVVVAGPGLGKSTLLRKMALLYAHDGYPVLRVSLRPVAAAMRGGISFVDAILQWGLGTSGIPLEKARHIGFRGWVLLADGLDECGAAEGEIADSLADFAAGHPDTRIVVTTRPVGYRASRLAEWRHYCLQPPEVDKGAVHLATLLHALSPGDSPRGEVQKVADAALGTSGSAKVIAGSPALLGLGASLLVRGGSLGGTRTALYARLLRQIMDTPNLRSSIDPPLQPIRERVVELLGRAVVDKPLSSIEGTTEDCAVRLAAESKIPLMQARGAVAASLRHWEEIGLIERLHHTETTLLTFTHKTFAEYAAARWLASDHTLDEQLYHVREVIARSEWFETLRFATGMGLGELVVSELLRRDATPTVSNFTQIVELLDEEGAGIIPSTRSAVIHRAFEIVDRGEEGLEVGLALLNLRPGDPEVVRCATRRLIHSAVEARLLAWALLAEAGLEDFDLEEGTSALQAIVPEVSPPMRSSLLGGLVVGSRRDAGILQRFALALVKRLLEAGKSDTARSLADGVLSTEPLTTYGFQRDLGQSLRTIGWSPRALRDFDASAFLRYADGARELSLATRAMLRTIFEPLAAGVPEDTGAVRRGSELELRAFIELTCVMTAVVSDAYAWTRPHDEAVIKEVIEGLAKVSDLDARALATQAAAALVELDAKPDAEPFDVLKPHLALDLPQPDWRRARQLDLDTTRLEQALAFRSSWFVYVAANLLEGTASTCADRVRELLGRLHGDGLRAAAYLASELGGDQAVELLLERITGTPVPGMACLFEVLRKLAPPWSSALADTLRHALLRLPARAAAAAAEYAESLTVRGDPVDPQLLDEAFAHWLIHEEPYPVGGGTVPTSPREALLRTRLALGTVGDAELLLLNNDPRSDIRDMSKAALLSRLVTGGEIRALFVEAVVGRGIGPAILAEVLRRRISLGASDAVRLRSFLRDADPRWRLAACWLLSPIYLDDLSLRTEIRDRTADEESEIRRTAARMARNLGLG